MEPAADHLSTSLCHSLQRQNFHQLLSPFVVKRTRLQFATQKRFLLHQFSTKQVRHQILSHKTINHKTIQPFSNSAIQPINNSTPSFYYSLPFLIFADFYATEETDSNEWDQAHRIFAPGQLLWCHKKLCAYAG